MLRFVIFPNLPVSPEKHSNPYIQDFIDALDFAEGSCVINKPHKNPLLSILSPKLWRQADVYVFNWFENIAESKYALLQSIAAVCLLLVLRLTKRQVVWMLHNKQNHSRRARRLSAFLRAAISRFSTLIITHATDGEAFIRQYYSHAAYKTHFIHHPTKSRLPGIVQASTPKLVDLLIWGHISPYKQVVEFLRYVGTDPDAAQLRISVVGRCTSDELRRELLRALPPGASYTDRSPNFEELAGYMFSSRFVLIPYSSESLLSSGALMDSLSYGMPVIGPNVGSFQDYAAEQELRVYTFRTFHDIPRLVKEHRNVPFTPRRYASFLQRNSWFNFANTFLKKVEHARTYHTLLL